MADFLAALAANVAVMLIERLVSYLARVLFAGGSVDVAVAA